MDLQRHVSNLTQMAHDFAARADAEGQPLISPVSLETSLAKVASFHEQGLLADALCPADAGAGLLVQFDGPPGVFAEMVVAQDGTIQSCVYDRQGQLRKRLRYTAKDSDARYVAKIRQAFDLAAS